MKKIEDYLHLYLRCEVKEIFNGRELEGSTILDSEKMIYFLSDQRKYKPILRPLSDMINKEAAEYAQFYHKSPIPPEASIEIKPKDGFVHVSLSLNGSGVSLFPGGPHGDKAEAFRYLLSKNFDLFGLIEAGLAIDKTKIA